MMTLHFHQAVRTPHRRGIIQGQIIKDGQARILVSLNLSSLVPPEFLVMPPHGGDAIWQLAAYDPQDVQPNV